MPEITLRILDGADRGRVYEDIAPPITLGREEGNSIQLNDERVSRFHAKIQQDHEDLVLTDLESTNGTKVNGEQTQLKILRHGDTITIGRSTILVGSRDEIQKRLSKIQDTNAVRRQRTESSAALDLDQDPDAQENTDLALRLLELEPPEIPERLTPGQAAQMAELLEYLHLQMRRVIKSAEHSSRRKSVELSTNQWQNLLELQSRLSEYLRKIGSPSE